MVWSSKPIFGKLPKNFGLPPYHFLCRTMIVAVWVHTEKVDGKEMKYVDKQRDDEIVHIDRTNTQRRIKEEEYKEIKSKHKIKDKEIIDTLDNTDSIAPSKDNYKRMVARSKNGMITIFENEKVVDMFKPEDTNSFFNNAIKKEKKEVIKSMGLIPFFRGERK